MKAVAPALALFAAALVLAAPANAAADRVMVSRTVQADLNGDGRLDRATVSQLPNTSQQRLTVTIGGASQAVQLPLESSFGVQPPRVVDVNGDGRDEVLVTESVGANTNRFSMVGLFGGVVRPVVQTHQAKLALWEGGGVSAISRYGCELVGGNRELVMVGAVSEDVAFEHFTGQRVTYRVDANGTAAVTSSVLAEGPRDAAVFQADPAACA